MAERIQKQKPAPRKRESEQTQTPKTEQRDLKEIDELLDDIDDVLEENAEQFVKDYIQAGGQ